MSSTQIPSEQVTDRLEWWIDYSIWPGPVTDEAIIVHIDPATSGYRGLISSIPPVAYYPLDKILKVNFV